MLYILIAGICSLVYSGVMLKKVDFRTWVREITIFTSMGILIGLISTIIINGNNFMAFSTKEYLAKNKNIQWEQYKKETIDCKSINITEEQNEYEIKCKTKNNINKNLCYNKDNVILCGNDGYKKIEVYELPYPELTNKENILTFAPLFRALLDENFTIYKVYNM